MKSFFILLVLIGATAGGAYYLKHGPSEHGIAFRTAPVKRGTLTLTVGATGTVEPEEVVDVGAQVVGRIKELGPDRRGQKDPKYAGKHVDYGSEVEEGDLLARIDPSIYLANRNQAKASLDRAVADLGQLKAHAAQTEAEWVRAQKLRSISVSVPSTTGSAQGRAAIVPVKGISDADFILARANYQVAAANVEVGNAVVAQQQSALDLTDTNLGYTYIKSPVKGTIIARRVNIGQTVVSSLNAPSLFLIAKDLRRMQVWASVNEADIGGLKVGTPVEFTVDAFPKDTFRGEVTQIRLNASMTQNVVTYTVIVTTDNSDSKLLPYLTADVKFELAKRENVLLVPNAALRYKPRPELIASNGGSPTTGEASPDQTPLNPNPQNEGDEGQGTLWIKTGKQVYPVHVELGVTDNTFTEVSSQELNEQMEVVLGEEESAGSAESVNNPFAPNFRRGRRSS
jgi:HlyD family secretion protein